MEKSKLRVESYDPGNKVIKITPAESFDYRENTELISQTIMNLTKIKQIRLILDLKSVLYPTASFIAFIIEVSSLLKRQGGELYILNLSHTAHTNFVSFSAVNFLNIVKNEEKFKQDLKIKSKNENSNAEVADAEKLDQKTSKADENIPEPEFTINDPLSKHAGSDDNIKRNFTKPAHFSFSEPEIKKPERKKEYISEKIVVLSREDQLYKLSDFIAIHAEKAGFEHTEVSRIKISVYEAAHNIIEHAYEFNATSYIEMNIKYGEKKFSIYLMDKGKAFEYDPNTDYSAIEAAEQRRTGGFGLHIIRRSMDDVSYECNPIWGNRLIMVKNIP